jgi:hypothetical protein
MLRFSPELQDVPPLRIVDPKEGREPHQQIWCQQQEGRLQLEARLPSSFKVLVLCLGVGRCRSPAVKRLRSHVLIEESSQTPRRQPLPNHVLGVEQLPSPTGGARPIQPRPKSILIFFSVRGQNEDSIGFRVRFLIRTPRSTSQPWGAQAPFDEPQQSGAANGSGANPRLCFSEDVWKLSPALKPKSLPRASSLRQKAA